MPDGRAGLKAGRAYGIRQRADGGRPSVPADGACIWRADSRKHLLATNWFSKEAICRFHQVKEGTEAHLQMLQKYVQAMRNMHQNVFFIQLDEKCGSVKRALSV